MNSQRLEEIVAVLMRPISSDARRCFDTDLTALLEEYLTEAGLHALAAPADAPAADVLAPNYPELALLLQHSATIYGRKVDVLYQHVLDVSESLQTSAPEPADAEGAGPASPATPAGRTARRRASTPRVLDFLPIAGVRDARMFSREPPPARPHPSLPRMFVELEPRVMTGADPPLYDYAGELIGLLADSRASADLTHTMMLVGDDDFEADASSGQSALRPISMLELQAAIEAAAPPPLSLSTPPSSPLRTSTPLPATDTTAATDATSATDTTAAADDTSATDATSAAETTTATDASAAHDATADVSLATLGHKVRKRRHSVLCISDIVEGSMKIIMSEELRKQLIEVREFSIPRTWIKRIVNKRKSHILSERCRLRELEPEPAGRPRPEPATSPADVSDESGGCDSGGEGGEAGDAGPGGEGGAFAGFGVAEVAEAAARAAGWRAGEPPLESDDDGFFDQSSVGDGCDVTRADDCAAWQAAVLARARAAEQRGGPDVRALGGAVLRALAPGARAPLRHVLRRTARRDQEVSHVLLATLFLANAGDIEVLPGAPLSVDSCALRLRGADGSQFHAQ